MVFSSTKKTEINGVWIPNEDILNPGDDVEGQGVIYAVNTSKHTLELVHGDQTITLKAPGKQGCVQPIPPVFLGEPAILALWENQWMRVFRSSKHISEFTSGFRARLDEIVDKEEREKPRIVEIDDGNGMNLEDKHTIVLKGAELDNLQNAVDSAMNLRNQ